MADSKPPNELYVVVGNALVDKTGYADGQEEITEAVWDWIQDNFQPLPRMMPVFKMQLQEKPEPNSD